MYCILFAYKIRKFMHPHFTCMHASPSNKNSFWFFLISPTLHPQDHYNTRANTRQRMVDQEQELERMGSELEDLQGNVGQIMEFFQVTRAKTYLMLSSSTTNTKWIWNRIRGSFLACRINKTNLSRNTHNGGERWPPKLNHLWPRRNWLIGL